MLSWQDAEKRLKNGYPTLNTRDKQRLKRARSQLTAGQAVSEIIPADLNSYLDPFPFSDYLKRVWVTDPRYVDHGPQVLNSMNTLLSGRPGKVLPSTCPGDQRGNLLTAVSMVLSTTNGSGMAETFFRLAALYHDIGKFVIPERHPTVGWYVVQYVNPEETAELRRLLGDELFRLMLVILRDHDHFGVLSTGEASMPLLRRSINSGGDLEEKKRIVSALLLTNLADMFGTFPADGEATDRMVGDWRWVLGALDHCSSNGLRVDDYLLEASGRVRSATRDAWEARLVKEMPYVTVPCLVERIRRLFTEASRGFAKRRAALDDERLLIDRLHSVFGSDNAELEFSRQLACVCKLDYAKRFFESLVEYCEGGPGRAADRVTTDNLIYAALSVLKRITTTYAPMLRLGSTSANLIGVELKDLTPINAPEKTHQIIELIVASHYPGLTWMMSDVPAWYF